MIKDATSETFARDVLDQSVTVPVVVEFWAPWSGPSKQLGPALEKAVTAAAGAVKLVRIDVDQNHEIAEQMRIKSIPAVFAFHEGRPVEGFVGALPESQIKAFIDKVLTMGDGAPGAEGPEDVPAKEETKVFISYRRKEGRFWARDIYKALGEAIGADCVFMDVDSIPPGANSRKILKGWVDECDIMLALIGEDWIDNRRLENANDLVRIEIGEALARDIPVVPVLLDGAPVPDAARLPSDLRELADRQAEHVEFRTLDSDVARLIKKLGLG